MCSRIAPSHRWSVRSVETREVLVRSQRAGRLIRCFTLLHSWSVRSAEPREVLVRFQRAGRTGSTSSNTKLFLRSVDRPLNLLVHTSCGAVRLLNLLAFTSRAADASRLPACRCRPRVDTRARISSVRAGLFFFFSAARCARVASGLVAKQDCSRFLP